MCHVVARRSVLHQQTRAPASIPRRLIRLAGAITLLVIAADRD
jgi:hypothetical protein